MELFLVLFAVLQLVVVGLVVLIVLRAAGMAVGADRDPSAVTRRVFVLALLYGVLLVVAWGAIGLASEFAAGTRRSNAALAGALAFLTVGGPSSAVLLRVVDRRLRHDDEERTSIVWRSYLLLALLTGLAGSMVAGQDALRAALTNGGDPRIDLEAVVATAAWSVLWAGHWFHFRRRYESGSDDLHLAVGSVAGLTVTAVGAAGLLARGGDAVYSSAFATGGDPTPSWAAPAAASVVGGVVWTWYWWLNYRTADRTEFWYLVVVPVGSLGGFAAAVIGAALVVYRIGVWFAGDPGSGDAAIHFETIPQFLAAVIVGLAVWTVHRRLLGADTSRSEAIRAHDYLLALAGLVGATVGVVLLGSSVLSHGPIGVANTVVAGVTALAVGGAVWSAIRRRIGRFVTAEPAAELDSPVRRMYLLTVFGVGGVAALVGMLTVLSGVFEDLLEGTLSRSTVHDERIGLALIPAVAAVIWFHLRLRRRWWSPANRWGVSAPTSSFTNGRAVPWPSPPGSATPDA